jgi:hypothetical protein
MPELNEWDSFYVIIGSAAGALIGLQFVVLTLIAERPPVDPLANSAFSTPTIVHFSAVLLLSAVLRAPWHSLVPIALLWALGALAGIIYTLIVTRRVKRQTAYQPGVEDWTFHVALPLASYVALGVLALFAEAHERVTLFGLAAVALALLFVGIHNAWDAVVYHVVDNRGSKSD